MVICGFSFTLLFCLYSLQIAMKKNRGKKDFLLPCITNQISFPTKSFVKIEFGQNICHISLCFVTFSCNCCTSCYYVVFILLLPIIFVTHNSTQGYFESVWAQTTQYFLGTQIFWLCTKNRNFPLVNPGLMY